jgi:hypothetical protein
MPTAPHGAGAPRHRAACWLLVAGCWLLVLVASAPRHRAASVNGLLHTMACWLIPIAKFRRNLKTVFWGNSPPCQGHNIYESPPAGRPASSMQSESEIS